MQNRPQPVTLMLVALVGVLWGLNFPAVKFMLVAVQPFTLRAAGFTGGAVILLVMVRALGHRLMPQRAEVLPIIAAGIFVLFGFNILTALGQRFTEASRAAIIVYSMPAMTAVLAAIFLNDPLTRRRIIAVLTGLAGLGVMASADFAMLMAAPLGPLLMLMAALSWAVGNVLVQARQWTLTPLALTFWFFLLSLLLAWPLALWLEPTSTRHLPPLPVIAVFAFHIAGPMATCYLLWAVLLRRLPATVAAISALTAPAVGVLSSVLLLGETATWQKMLALGLIVLSIAIALTGRKGRQGFEPEPR